MLKQIKTIILNRGPFYALAQGSSKYRSAVVDSRLQYLYTKTYDNVTVEVEKRSDNVNQASKHLENRGTYHDTSLQNFVKNNLQKELNDQEVNAKEGNDGDIFGYQPLEAEVEDAGDIAEENYQPKRRLRKNETMKYASLIKDYLRQQRLLDAINVLEVRMMKEDRVQPEPYIYGLILGGCSRQGYTRKCFRLYTKMKQCGYKIKPPVYTALFNACANAPTSEDGLTRAHRLRAALKERLYEPNIMNYNSMIKAFGRWGDIKAAFSLADEMIDKQLPFSTETYNFLIQACAGDPKLGFRHSILLWHKMLAKGIEPDYYSFKSIIRCVRDCGFGSIGSMQELFQQILKKSPLLIEESPKYFSRMDNISTFDGSTSSVLQNTTPRITADHPSNQRNPFNTKTEENNGNFSESINNSLEEVVCSEDNKTSGVSLTMPNLLAAEPTLGSLIRLSEVQEPHERFILLGGLSGFLEEMKKRNITPSIEMFTALLEVIPPTKTAEKQLLSYVRRIGLKADIDFFNILIKQRSMRFDYEGGKEVLNMIRVAGLYPDIVTYGVLALGCRTVEEARELLQEMNNKNIRINIEILGAMLRQGMVNNAFPYICDIIQISLDENIKPNEIFIRHLRKFYLKCAKAIDSRYPWTKTKSFQKGYQRFCTKYRLYQEEHRIDNLKLEDAIKKIQERPYQQYMDEGARDCNGQEILKNTRKARKQKLRKYIKKIKIQSLQDDQDPQQNTDEVQMRHVSEYQ